MLTDAKDAESWNPLKKIALDSLEPYSELDEVVLSLTDGDWPDYKIETTFHTKDQGLLIVVFQYCGATTSRMKVTRIYDDVTSKPSYEFSTDIFEKYLIKYMKAHIDSWTRTRAFNGDEIIIDFFNEVLDVGKILLVCLDSISDIPIG